NAGWVHVTWWQNSFGLGYNYRNPGNGAWAGPTKVPGSGAALQYMGLAVDRGSGDVHLSFLNFVNDSEGYSLNYTKTNGPTGAFSNPIEVAGRATNYRKTRLAWSPTGRVIVIADRGSPNFSLTYNTSDNNGASWNGEATLPGTGTVETPWIVAGSDGTGYVT